MQIVRLHICFYYLPKSSTVVGRVCFVLFYIFSFWAGIKIQPGKTDRSEEVSPCGSFPSVLHSFCDASLISSFLLQLVVVLCLPGYC